MEHQNDEMAETFQFGVKQKWGLKKKDNYAKHNMAQVTSADCTWQTLAHVFVNGCASSELTEAGTYEEGYPAGPSAGVKSQLGMKAPHFGRFRLSIFSRDCKLQPLESIFNCLIRPLSAQKNPV